MREPLLEEEHGERRDRDRARRRVLLELLELERQAGVEVDQEQEQEPVREGGGRRLDRGRRRRRHRRPVETAADAGGSSAERRPRRRQADTRLHVRLRRSPSYSDAMRSPFAQQHAHDARRRHAVPLLGNAAERPLPVDRLERRFDDRIRIAADDAVRALEHGRGPFGRLPQREARHAQHRRLLLHAARIGEHQRALLHQLQEVEIAERIGEQDVGQRRQAVPDPQRVELAPRARVHRKDDRDPPLDPLERGRGCPPPPPRRRRCRAGGA